MPRPARLVARRAEHPPSGRTVEAEGGGAASRGWAQLVDRRARGDRCARRSSPVSCGCAADDPGHGGVGGRDAAQRHDAPAAPVPADTPASLARRGRPWTAVPLYPESLWTELTWSLARSSTQTSRPAGVGRRRSPRRSRPTCESRARGGTTAGGAIVSTLAVVPADARASPRPRCAARGSRARCRRGARCARTEGDDARDHTSCDGLWLSSIERRGIPTRTRSRLEGRSSAESFGPRRAPTLTRRCARRSPTCIPSGRGSRTACR